MALLAECPICRRKQSVRNRLCAGCGDNLVRLKRQARVKYWIDYRLPDGRQIREAIGYSINEARDAEGKRRAQKRENRIFDVVADQKATFDQVKEWYLDLPTVQKLSSYRRVKSALAHFIDVFGHRVVCQVVPSEIEAYQLRRKEQGAAPATVDMEVSIARTMINKAFENGLLSGNALRLFRPVKRLMRQGDNARKRIITVSEYLALLDAAAGHLKPIIVTAFNTGMRMGELLNLQWDHIDRKTNFLRLSADMTKERRAKAIPINKNLKAVLAETPRAILHDFVFTYKGHGIHENGIKRSFSTACRNAGVPFGRKVAEGVTFHDIRRTVKTNMFYAGVDKVYRDLILGHSLKGMDMHYLSPSDEALKWAMDRYAKWLDEQIAELQHREQQILCPKMSN